MGLLGWFSESRAIGHAKRELDSEVSAARGFRAKPYLKVTKNELNPLRKDLEKIIPNLEVALARNKADRLKLIEKARSKVVDINESREFVMKRESDWIERRAEIEGTAASLIRETADYPGKQFASDVDKRKKDVSSTLRKALEFENVQKINEHMDKAAARLRDLRTMVSEATELRAGFPVLARSVATIDEMGVQQYVSFQESYNNLLELRGDIEKSLREGKYSLGFRLLADAREKCAALETNVARRQNLARQEIDLWLDDEEISTLFNLKSFPHHLRSTHTQKWTELRIEIGRLVQTRASRARNEYAKLRPRGRELIQSWEELADWTVLEEFSSASRDIEMVPPS